MALTTPQSPSDFLRFVEDNPHLFQDTQADRERKAVIIKAEGEVAAASNMAKAAHTLSLAPGALHLRTLQSINDLSSDQSNTVIFAIPLEILRAFEGMKKK